MEGNLVQNALTITELRHDMAEKVLYVAPNSRLAATDYSIRYEHGE